MNHLTVVVDNKVEIENEVEEVIDNENIEE